MIAQAPTRAASTAATGKIIGRLNSNLNLNG
jgi:hypothetical protein